MLEKFKSRKFLMALLSVILGTLGMVGVADGTIELVATSAMILIPVIVYIVTEGKIDTAAISKIIDAVDEILDVIEDKDEDKIEEGNSETKAIKKEV